ncbi:hypothetical protein N0V87_006435 [Didymella glomerata]|uniref:Uncharacterized protein n=1 Tax=Didymella glomerata TaxID=749621 RepID=A0A9W8WWS9_9PLEO|nr:hypothetical protein N0V87_006435 [Didymella glomerata]
MLTLTQAEKHETILALQQHRINTLPSLRRVELAFAALNTPDVAEPMTAAWTYYVSSHGLLTELRALTRSCPFSSHCVEEAKRRVYANPESNCSWNLAWLVLRKIKDDQLVAYYAQYQAAQPASWGGRTPKEEQAKDFSDKLQREWKGAAGMGNGSFEKDVWAMTQLQFYTDIQPRFRAIETKANASQKVHHVVIKDKAKSWLKHELESILDRARLAYQFETLAKEWVHGGEVAMPDLLRRPKEPIPRAGIHALRRLTA